MSRIDEALRRAMNGESAEAREHQEMHERLACRRDARAIDVFAQLVAAQRPLVRQRAFDRLEPAFRSARIHARLLETPRVAGEELRCRERVQPPVVLSPDEVQGATVQPADHERAVVRQSTVDVGGREAARARTNGKPRAAQVLRLNREQPVRDRDRVGAALVGEELRRESRFHTDF